MSDGFDSDVTTCIRAATETHDDDPFVIELCMQDIVKGVNAGGIATMAPAKYADLVEDGDDGGAYAVFVGSTHKRDPGNTTTFLVRCSVAGVLLEQQPFKAGQDTYYSRRNTVYEERTKIVFGRHGEIEVEVPKEFLPHIYLATPKGGYLPSN